MTHINPNDALSLVSLNIESNRHLTKIKPFLETHQPDTLCLQELSSKDIPFFESIIGGKGHFAPMSFTDSLDNQSGIGIFTALPCEIESIQYAGHFGELLEFQKPDYETCYKSQQFHLLVAKVVKNNKKFTIATTHMPVTERGEAADYQLEALRGLLLALAKYDNFVLCGDLNAPRGGEVFGQLAKKYRDNIPPKYENSLDYDLHRAGKEKLQADAASIGLNGHMVDCLFSTPAYVVSDVELTCGLSDHCAVNARVNIS